MRFVKAASLDRLVDALVTDDGELESTFVNVFLGEFQLSLSHPVFPYCMRKLKTLRFSLHSHISNIHKDGQGFRASATTV